MGVGTLFALCPLVLSQGAEKDDLALLHEWQLRSSQDPEAAENLVYLHLRAGQWEGARQWIERRHLLGPTNRTVAMYSGDLAFWEGDLEAARRFYKDAMVLDLEKAFLPTLEERVVAVDRERAYRDRVRKASSRARWLGWASILFLLLSPFALLVLWHPREGKEKGPGGFRAP